MGSYYNKTAQHAPEAGPSMRHKPKILNIINMYIGSIKIMNTINIMNIMKLTMVYNIIKIIEI